MNFSGTEEYDRLVEESGEHLKVPEDLAERLLLPCNMLRAEEDVFLDDFTVSQVESALQVPLNIVKSSGQDLLDAILARNPDAERP